MNPAFAYGEAPTDSPLPNPDVLYAEIMGGSGTPIPSEGYNGLATREGLYPLTGTKDLPRDTSMSRGVTILDQAISQQLAVPGTSPVGIFGYSQSAIISSLEMNNLVTTGVSPSDVNFVLVGDPMNPNGGLLERFAGVQLPSPGLNFYGATPSDAFPTTICMLECDGYEDFPPYPLDFPADLNAFFGIQFVHGRYPGLTDAQLATAQPSDARRHLVEPG